MTYKSSKIQFSYQWNHYSLVVCSPKSAVNKVLETLGLRDSDVCYLCLN